MATCNKFLRSLVFIVLTSCSFFHNFISIEAKETSVAGRTYYTGMEQLDHGHYRVKLRNPCSGRMVRLEYQEKSNQNEFKEKMKVQINSAIEILEQIVKADPNIRECVGLGLKTLPNIPQFRTLSEEDRVTQMYKVGIYFASHLRIMSLDRQLVVNNSDTNNFLAAGMSASPKYFRCGTESQNLVKLFDNLTRTMEDLLCEIVDTFNDDKYKSSFEQMYDELMTNQMLRFQTCSSMEVRDCVVIHELHQILHMIHKNFQTDEFHAGGNINYGLSLLPRSMNYNLYNLLIPNDY